MLTRSPACMWRSGLNNNASTSGGQTNHVTVRLYKLVVTACRSCDQNDALVGPRCPLSRGQRGRAGFVTPGLSWSSETTLSGTLNVTGNVESSLDGESRFPLTVLEYVAAWTLFMTFCLLFMFCTCFFLCGYTFVKKIVTASRRYQLMTES